MSTRSFLEDGSFAVKTNERFKKYLRCVRCLEYIRVEYSSWGVDIVHYTPMEDYYQIRYLNDEHSSSQWYKGYRDEHGFHGSDHAYCAGRSHYLSHDLVV